MTYMVIWKMIFMAPLLFGSMPATTNYELRDYGFGNGGGTAGTANYQLEGIAGEQSGQDMGTATYSLKSGLFPVQMANVPGAPTVTNPDDTYDKLHVVLSAAANPTDALFAIAISKDDFSTTQYVQDDNTVGTSLGIEDYQTYADWGGATGFDVIGLDYNTTYKFKVKATQGNYSESGYGPVASGQTSELKLTFDIDVAASDTATNPPYQVSFGNLSAATVNDSPVRVWFSMETNALSGGKVYIVSQHSGLRSEAASYTISSVSGDLDVLNEGYGAQGVSATQASGGPFTIEAPYNGNNHNTGVIDASYRAMFSTTGPIYTGRSSFLFKAKTTPTTPAAPDYADLYTAVAAAAY